MHRKGFTLLELIVVLVVLAALVAIALPLYTGFVEKSKAAEAINAMAMIKTGETLRRMSSGTYGPNETNGTINSSLGIGLVNTSSPGWTYATVADGGTSFTATATRVNTAQTQYNGTTIAFTYNYSGSVAWSGNHPGAPR